MPGVLVKMDPSQPSATKIHEDALFFDKLVELVPAKFYFGTDEEDQSWKYMHNKTKTPAARQAAKEGLKKAKRAKLDPSNQTSNLEIQKKRAQEEQAAKEQEQDAGPQNVEAGAPPKMVAFQNGGPQASHAELTERLQKKIKGLRAKREVEEEKKEKKRKRNEDKRGQKQEGRKGGEKAAQNAQGSEGKAEVGIALQSTTQGGGQKAGKKSPKVDGVSKAPAVDGAPLGNAKEEAARPLKKAKPSKASQPTSSPLPAAPPLQFNKLELKPGNATKRREKHRKRDQKKTLLKKATELQTELKESKGTKEGQEKIAKHAWSASLKRASGEKVLDDPKLLKKSIKSEEKRREHSAKKWKGRQAQDREAVKTRQEKRSTNLKQRADAKKDRKIKKREKKLLNPGRKKST